MPDVKKDWRKPDGTPVSCTEKIKVLNENYAEIKESIQEALDDAVLMGCSIEKFKEIYREMLEKIEASYPEQNS